jgi:hypothetical protein
VHHGRVNYLDADGGISRLLCVLLCLEVVVVVLRGGVGRKL